MELPISICATSPSSDEKAEMKFRFTLQRRLFLWFTLLFVVLTGAILFVIEKKEVATIYEESTNKAVLIARHTADRNLQSILTWDMDRLQRDADRRRADAPLYVVFYDRYATPLVTAFRGKTTILNAISYKPSISRPASRPIRIFDNGSSKPLIKLENCVLTLNPIISRKACLEMFNGSNAPKNPVSRRIAKSIITQPITSISRCWAIRPNAKPPRPS